MSIHRIENGVFDVRWREGGRNKSQRIRGSHELAKKVERKKMSARDENRHLDIRREKNFRMSELIDRYILDYGQKKLSADRERSILEVIREEMGMKFVREIDGKTVGLWYDGLTTKRGLAANTAVRHFNVMHHMMEKASTIWADETGLARNPADLIEVKRPDDERDRYLSADELKRLRAALDAKKLRRGTKDLNQTQQRLRAIVFIAVTTGMRMSEIHGLCWTDIMFSEKLIAVRAKLKGGKMRYVPLLPYVAEELKAYPKQPGEDRIFPPKPGATSGRQRLEGSFDDLLERAKIWNFRFHDLRHTFASWFMMLGGDLYTLAKILGHSNIKMTERYAKLGKAHIASTGSTALGVWELMQQKTGELPNETT
jgi:integrase